MSLRPHLAEYTKVRLHKSQMTDYNAFASQQVRLLGERLQCFCQPTSLIALAREPGHIFRSSRQNKIGKLVA